MVLDLIIGVALGLINGVLMLLPSWTPPDWDAMGGSLGGVLAGANNFFPVTTLAVCVALLVGLQFFAFSWGAIVYVYRLIPLKFT